MHRSLLAAAALAVACAPVASCGSSQKPVDRVPATETLSAAEHMEEADRHEREAEAHRDMTGSGDAPEASSVQVSCVDTSTAGVPTSGGERITLVHPCWTSASRPDARHRERAAMHDKWAREHEAAAAKLLGAEKRACRGLPPEAVEHSPFFHAQDIAAVDDVMVRGQLRGIRVAFRKVPGLTLEFMERAVACHRARAAAMGYSTTFMPTCPLALEDIQVTSESPEDSQEVVVTIRSKRGEIAAAAKGRVNDLVEDRKGAP